MEDKFLYFFISYAKNQKENENDIDIVLAEKKNLMPICIYVDERYNEDQIYYCNRIFKVSKSAARDKKGNIYYFEFEKNDE